MPFKVLRGMASIQAIRDRLDVEDADTLDIEALGAEGTEVSVPARGSVRPIIQDILRHLCSSISYGGARSLAELKQTVLAAIRFALPDQAVGVGAPRVVRAVSAHLRPASRRAKRDQPTCRHVGVDAGIASRRLPFEMWWKR